MPDREFNLTVGGLGADGSALVNHVLIDAKTTKQIVESRGKNGTGLGEVFCPAVPGMPQHAGRGLRVLELRASGTQTQIIGAQ